MKRLLLIILLSVQVVCFSQIKNAGCFLRMVAPIQSNDNLSMENDSIKISFDFDEMNYFCNVSIKNKTKDVFSVNWDKFIMVMEGKSQPILFDDTTLLNKDAPKGSTSIAPGTSLVKNIAPVEYIDLQMHLYSKGWVKKRGNQEIVFLTPIIYGDKLEYYTCKISISLE